jgi:predicted acetyltransferase
MSFEVRTLTSEEMADAAAISAYAFNAPGRHEMTELAERLRRTSQPDWFLGSFEDGEMTAMMCVLPVEMYLNGGTLPFGAVSPVASSPLHRRKGHAAAMLRYSLATMRERGQVISGLSTPHPALYRRYGWEIAADARAYCFKPKDFRSMARPRQRGRFRMLKTTDWQELDPIHRAYAQRHNGPFLRGEGWWRDYVLETPWRPAHDIVVWQSDSGESEGYAVYQQPSTGPDAGKVVVLELVTLSGDAYLNLHLYFAGHDINREILLWASRQDPLPVLLEDAEKLEIKEGFTVMLRVIDFEAAMRWRRAAREDDVCEVVLRIEDELAPWNDGTWRAGIAEGRTHAARVDEEPEIEVSARVLGSLFNGYLRPSVAHESGMVTASNADALDRADRIFAARKAPFFTDHF